MRSLRVRAKYDAVGVIGGVKARGVFGAQRISRKSQQTSRDGRKTKMKRPLKDAFFERRSLMAVVRRCGCDRD